MKTRILLLLLGGAIGNLATASSDFNDHAKALKVVAQCVEAMGGMQAFQQIGLVQVTLEGTAYDEGQSASPTSAWFERDMYAEITYDFQNDRSYEKIRTIVKGDLIYDPVFRLGSDGSGTVHYPSTGEWFELTDLDANIVRSIPQLFPPRLLPARIIRDARWHAARLRYLGIDDGVHEIAFAENDGTQLTLRIDDNTKMLIGIELWTDHLVYGDTKLRIAYGNYGDQQGVASPQQVTITYNDHVYMELQASDWRWNADIDRSLFDVPEEASFTALPRPFVPQQVGEGLWFFAVFAGLGTTYNVLLAEFDDYFLVVDAPLHDAYSRVVGQIAQSISPGKSIQYVVPTHYHTDHLGGICGYVRAGTTIICRPDNEAFIRALSQVEHQIVPNALTNQPTVPIIQTFGKKHVLRDDRQEIVLYAIDDSPHVDEMTIAYFPKEKLLFVADLLMVAPGSGKPESNASLDYLKSFIKKHDLTVQRFAPAHGVIINADMFWGRKVMDSDAAQSAPSIEKAEDGVRRAVVDYVDAFYAGDTAKLHQSMSADVYKFGYYRKTKDEAYVGERMSFQEMVDYALSVKKRGPVPSSAPRKVEVLDVQDKTAAAKLTAWWGVDYVLLGRENGRWYIKEVLWQSTDGS